MLFTACRVSVPPAVLLMEALLLRLVPLDILLTPLLVTEPVLINACPTDKVPPVKPKVAPRLLVKERLTLALPVTLNRLLLITLPVIVPPFNALIVP